MEVLRTNAYFMKGSEKLKKKPPIGMHFFDEATIIIVGLYKLFLDENEPALITTKSVIDHLPLKDNEITKHNLHGMNLPNDHKILYIDLKIGKYNGFFLVNSPNAWLIYYQCSENKFMEISIGKFSHAWLGNKETANDISRIILSILIELNTDEYVLESKIFYSEFSIDPKKYKQLNRKYRRKIKKHKQKSFNEYRLVKKRQSVSGFVKKKHSVASHTRVYKSGKTVLVKSHFRGR